MSNVTSKLEIYEQKGLINAKLKTLMKEFYDNYQQACDYSSCSEKKQAIFEHFIELVVDKIQHPYAFSIFHQSIRQPFDYYQFGLDFIRPFVDFSRSKIFGMESLKSIQDQLDKGENVILFANHQTEPDPQIISLLLETTYPKLGSEIIFVAGHRVISDPLAIPLSLGCNLLCIYSKKHMSYPPEEKAQKVLHNQRTIQRMKELLNAGGCCIYVAPSGGRDRANALGKVDVAPFDPQSIELFWLMGQQAERPTHFYPLSLKTYHLMPPPRQVEKELGERRVIHMTPVYLAFGEEIDRDHFSVSENLDKRTKRNKRAEYIWKKVCQNYQSFPENSSIDSSSAAYTR
jgi:glycerol-3-phosphate O-acyltransferase